MLIKLSDFEQVCRRAHVVHEAGLRQPNSHPFQERSLHGHFPVKVRKLFDDGHYSESTFEAVKFFDKKIQSISSSSETGHKLMMNALNSSKPLIKLTALADQSHMDEQEGYRFLFAGLMSAIRNPRGHEYAIEDNIDTCLDHLAIISACLRRLELAGYSVTD